MVLSHQCRAPILALPQCRAVESRDLYCATNTALSLSQTCIASSSSFLNNATTNSTTDKKASEKLSPATIRFITLYLHAVLKQYTSSTSFSARDAFVQLWRSSSFDRFSICKSWAKKALQRALKATGSEWSKELAHAHRTMGSEYDIRGRRFVGSLVPGRAGAGRAVGGRAVGGQRADRTLTSQAREERVREESHARRKTAGDVGHCATVCVSGEEQATEVRATDEGETEIERRGEASGLLDALRAPFPASSSEPHAQDLVDDEATMVCDLRTAILCVQTTQPGDILPALLQLFPYSSPLA